MTFRLRLKGKLLLVPALGTAFMLVLLGETIVSGRADDALLARIETGYAPALGLSRDLIETLAAVQRAFQFAVASEDLDALVEADKLQAAFFELLAKTRQIPTIDPGRSGGQAAQFRGYYALARGVSERLIRKGSREGLTEKLEEMTEQYTYLRQRLESDASFDRRDMAESFSAARKSNLAATLLEGGVILMWALAGGLIALALARQVASRVTNLRDASARVGAGDLGTVCDDAGRDELGELAESFNQMARALRAARGAADAGAEQLRTVVETAHDAIVISTGGRVLGWNAAAARIFGWTSEAAVGRLIIDLIVPERMHDRFREMHGQIERREIDRMEVVSRRRDGAEFPVELRFGVATSPAGVLVIAFGRDLTRDRALELELRQAQKLESVGRLAAGIAHEINTPIQFIGDSAHFLGEAFRGLDGLFDSYAALREAAATAVAPELLAKVAQAEEDADLQYSRAQIPKAIERTLDGISRVATIVRAMKRFAHPDTEEKRSADLNAALVDTLAVARNEMKYVAKVETDLGELPPVACHLGDLNQVFLNLLVNAAHAIADRQGASGVLGTIRVSSRRERDQAVIDIADSGCGISAANRERIFEPFFTTKEVGRGTGQGLAIARSIVVDKHGGTLSFQSEVGVGTTFSVRLPIGAPV